MDNKNSNNLINCDYCYSCDSCDSCNYCYSCDSCYYCDYCYYCDSCDSCNYCKNLKMTEYNIFCWAETFDNKDSFQQDRYRAFNKVVGEERYDEILELIKYDIFKDLKPGFSKNNWKDEWKKVTYDIFKDLKPGFSKNNWKDEWKKVTTEQWRRILEIPEADKEIIENIIGFELNLNDTKTVKIKLKGGEIVEGELIQN